MKVLESKARQERRERRVRIREEVAAEIIRHSMADQALAARDFSESQLKSAMN